MYLGRIVEEGAAVGRDRAPAAPLHASAGRCDPGARAGRRREPRAARRRASRRDRRPQRLPLPPALPAAVRAVRPRRPAAAPAGGARPARRLPAARPAAERPTPSMAERWRDIAGPIGLLDPGPRNAITDVPGVRVGHSQAASGERTGVTVVAPPALPAAAGAATVNGTGELTGRHRDRRGGADRDARLPVRDARGRHRLPGRDRGVRARARTTSSIPVVGECDDGDLADSRTVAAADVEAALRGARAPSRRGQRRRRHGDAVLRLPRRHRDRLAPGRRAHRRRPAAVQLRDRPYLDVLGRSLGPEPERPMPHGSCIAICATDAPLDPLAAAPPRAAPAARPRPHRLLRIERLGRDRHGLLDRAVEAARPWRPGGPDRLDRRSSPPPTRQRTRPSSTASSPPGPPGASTASMQDAFPIDAVRRMGGRPRA